MLNHYTRKTMKKTIIMQALFAIMVLNISCGGKELSEYEIHENGGIEFLS